MKVYIATRFEDQQRAREFAAQVEALGWEVTATWLQEQSSSSVPMGVPDFVKFDFAIRDMEDIDSANLFIALIPEEPVLRGGMHWETGYATARGIPVFIVGPRVNIFHYLYPQWDSSVEMLDYLRGWAQEMETPDAARAEWE